MLLFLNSLKMRREKNHTTTWEPYLESLCFFYLLWIPAKYSLQTEVFQLSSPVSQDNSLVLKRKSEHGGDSSCGSDPMVLCGVSVHALLQDIHLTPSSPYYTHLFFFFLAIFNKKNLSSERQNVARIQIWSFSSYSAASWNSL